MNLVRHNPNTVGCKEIVHKSNYQPLKSSNKNRTTSPGILNNHSGDQQGRRIKTQDNRLLGWEHMWPNFDFNTEEGMILHTPWEPKNINIKDTQSNLLLLCTSKGDEPVFLLQLEMLSSMKILSKREHVREIPTLRVKGSRGIRRSQVFC